MIDTPQSSPAGERDLLILVDVGNTNAVFGVYQGGELVQSLRLGTTVRRTVDEYLALLLPLFERARLNPSRAKAVLISSVVPPLHGVLVQMSQQLFGVEPSFIDSETETGLPLRYPNPAEIGADRIVNSLAAREIYGAPVVVVDFGTATTFDVVNAAGEYVGGLISPGIHIAAEALFSKASRLYRVDIVQPERLVGSTTQDAMQSGIYYGYLGQVDGILQRLKDEMPGLETIIATGGLASLMAEESKHIRHVDQMITLTGLRLIYERQQRTR